MTIQQLDASPLHVHHGWIAAPATDTMTARAASRGPRATELAVTTRPMDDDDAMLLFELYASMRLDEISRSGWVTPQQRSFFRDQAQNQERYFCRHHAHLDRRTICVNGFSAGRLLVDRAPTGYTLVDIALLPSFHGRGIGTLVMHDLLADAARDGVPVKATIDKRNPALSLCERLGFGRAIDLGDRVHLTWHPDAA